MDNFKNGIASFGMPVLPGADTNRSGNVYWVDYNGTNASDNTSSGSFDIPFKTLDYAIGRCTANNGDIIFIKEGHTETITASNTLAIDVAGITVIGLGDGNDRPKFTVSTDAAATITISGASTVLKNCIVIGALDGLNTAVTVPGDDCDLDFEYRDTSAAVEADIAVTCTGDRLKLNLRDIGFVAGDQRDQSVVLTGVDGARINIDMYGKVATAVVNFTGTSCTDVIVTGSVYVAGTTDGSKTIVDTVGSSTWYGEIYDKTAGRIYSGGSGATWAKADIATAISDIATISAAATTLDNAASDLTIAASDLTAASAVITAAASDIVIVVSDLKDVNTSVDKIQSDLIVTQSDVKIVNASTNKIQSDLIITQSDVKDINTSVDKIQSDLIIVQSDVKAISANISDAMSDIVIIQSDLKSNLSDQKLLQSDIVIIQSDLKSNLSDQKLLQSDVVIIMSDLKSNLSDQKLIQSDLVVMMSDIKVTNSDLVKTRSDLIITHSDVKTILSDLKAFFAKYASDVP